MATKRKSVKNAKTVTSAGTGTTGAVKARPAGTMGNAKAKMAKTKATPAAASPRPQTAAQSGRLRNKPAASAEPVKAATAPAASKGEGSSRKRATAKKHRRWPLYVVLGVVALLLVVVAAFSWDRWLRYDDALDFKGEWQPSGSTAVIVVDGESIKLTSDVAYTYELDPTAKTISFTFGNLSGAGRYRFSADRTQLVVTEGNSYSSLSTLFEDIAWMWDGFVRSVQGQVAEEPTAGEGTTVLERVSHDALAEPREGVASEPAATPPAEDAPAPDADEGADEGEGTGQDGASGATPAPDASDGSSEPNPDETGGDDGQAGDAPGASGDAGTGSSSSPGSLFDVNDV